MFFCCSPKKSYFNHIVHYYRISRIYQKLFCDNLFKAGLMLEWSGATKIGRLQMERHAKTIIKTNIAKEVLKEVERAIMAQAGKKSGSTLKNMPHKLNMGQEDLLLFALNADAVAFGCQIWNVSISGRGK